MALPQQGTETTNRVLVYFYPKGVLMALPQQGTETKDTHVAKPNRIVLMALPQQGTETLPNRYSVY